MPARRPSFFDRAAVLLRGQSSLDRPTSGSGRPPRPRRWCESLAHGLGQTVPRCRPVPQLRAVLRRHDDEGTVHQRSAQPRHESFPQCLRQRIDRGRGSGLPQELDTAVCGVDPLTAGSRRPREPPRELARGDAQCVGDADGGIHAPSMPAPPRADARRISVLGRQSVRSHARRHLDVSTSRPLASSAAHPRRERAPASSTSDRQPAPQRLESSLVAVDDDLGDERVRSDGLGDDLRSSLREPTLEEARREQVRGEDHTTMLRSPQ